MSEVEPESGLLERLQESEQKALLAAIDRIVEQKAARHHERARAPEYGRKLLKLHRSLAAEHDFTPGELVQWKANLKNKRRPEYSEPAVVIDVVEDPILDHNEPPGSPYFREPLSLIIGLVDDDDELVCYWVDKRRFEPYGQ